MIFLLRVLGRILTAVTDNERGTVCAVKGETEAQSPILRPMSWDPSLLQLSRVVPFSP